MIKLATVFSGIGAIEHALDRMDIPHEIVFACDNGDIEILTKNIGMNLDDIDKELASLQCKVDEIQEKQAVQDLYKDQLVMMLKEVTDETKAIVSTIEKQDLAPNTLNTVLKTICSNESLKKQRLKEYSGFLRDLNNGSFEQQKFRKMQVILEIVNDFKKDNPLETLGQDISFESSDGIDWSLISKDLKELYDYLESNDGKKVIRIVQDISQRLSQLHEKLNYIAVQKKLDSLGDN